MIVKRKLFAKSAEDFAKLVENSERSKLAKIYRNHRKTTETAGKMFKKPLTGEKFFDPNSTIKSTSVNIGSHGFTMERLPGESVQDFHSAINKGIKDAVQKEKIVPRSVRKENMEILNDKVAKAKELRSSRLEKVAKLKAKKARVKNAKIGAGIVAGTAVLGTGAYLAKKHHDKKKNKKKED